MARRIRRKNNFPANPPLEKQFPTGVRRTPVVKCPGQTIGRFSYGLADEETPTKEGVKVDAGVRGGGGEGVA